MVIITPKVDENFKQLITKPIVKRVYLPQYPKNGSKSQKTSFAFEILEEVNLLLIGKPQNRQLINIITAKNNTNGYKSTNRFLNKIADLVRGKPEETAKKLIMNFVDRVASKVKIQEKKV